MKTYFHIILIGFLFASCKQDSSMFIPVSQAHTKASFKVSDTVDVIIVIGQSNSCDRGHSYSLTLAERQTFQNAYSYYRDISGNGQWEQFHAGFNTQNGSDGGAFFGISTLIAYRLSSVYGRKVCIINAGVGGTILYDSVGIDTWNIHRSNSLYDTYLNKCLRPALASLPCHYNLIAAVWSQGEADCSAYSSSSSYHANLTDLFSRIRQDIGNPSFPIIVSEIQSSDLYQFTAGVHDAQIVVCNEMSDNHYFNTDNYPRIPGSPHYLDESYIGMGNALADHINGFIK